MPRRIQSESDGAFLENGVGVDQLGSFATFALAEVQNEEPSEPWRASPFGTLDMGQRRRKKRLRICLLSRCD